MATPILIGAAGGEYMETVTVVEWAVAPGAAVRRGDILVTVETAKAATEIEAPCDGVLSRILAEPGAEVAVTAVLGLVGADAQDTASSVQGETVDETRPAAPDRDGPRPASRPGRIVASPLARRTATALGVDLSRVTPTSPSGRIKLRDVNAYAAEWVPDAPAPHPAIATARTDEPGPLKVYRTGPDTGTPLVLLHGFANDSDSWHPLHRLLAQTHPVIRIDLPGHGRSPKRRMADFRLLAREIVEAFDALDLERAHLVGHSLGGACALALADVRSRRLASLTLIAPAGLGPAIDGEILHGLTRASQPDSLGPWLREIVGDPSMITDDFVNAAMASRADAALREGQRIMADDLFPDGTQGFSLTAALGRLKLPARLVWGRKDRLLPWRHALTAPGHVGLHLLPGVGHVPQLEATDLVADIIRSLVRGVE